MAKAKKCKLSKRQILFCQEYIKDSNTVKACIRAGYSINSAENIAKQHLLSNDVINYISYLYDMEIQQYFSDKREVKKVKGFYFRIR